MASSHRQNCTQCKGCPLPKHFNVSSATLEDMSGFSEIFGSKKCCILDGGLGTTLEDVFHKNVSDTPLWSAKPIDEDPEIMIQTHLAFLRAGARVISTSTYQCAFETFEDAGYSRNDAARLMRKSVELAAKARSRYVDEADGIHGEDVKIALSLGPYGATLTPAQEYGGFYPLPFGPQEYSTSRPNRNTFTKEERAAGKATMAIDALTDFHLQRLRVFANDIDTWANIDCIAFESVPLVREITAIRGAMALLEEELKPRAQRFPWKPWWISTVWPEGRYPQGIRPDGVPMTVKDVVAFLLSSGSGELKHVAVGKTNVPDGLGINCTRMEHLSTIRMEMEAAVADLKGGDSKPWFVVYPNGGETYDPVSRTWTKEEDPQNKSESWATRLGDLVDEARNSGVWDGVIVGGCCKTGPAEIQALSRRWEK